MLITAKMNREFEACYADELLAELYGTEGRTPDEVATIHDGQWAYVRLSHRVWILQRVLLRFYRPGWLEWLARLTERSLARVPNPDPRSVAVVTALRDDAVTQEIVADARAAAAAYAALAARAAAADAAALAADSADSAAIHADAASEADHAERRSQLKDLVELLKGK